MRRVTTLDTISLYIRFGEIPKDERSNIYQNGELIIGKEQGVSVWKAIKACSNYYPLLPQDANESAITDYFDYLLNSNKNVYLVTGEELETHGKDGEPLLRNVKIIKDITHIYRPDKHIQVATTVM